MTFSHPVWVGADDETGIRTRIPTPVIRTSALPLSYPVRAMWRRLHKEYEKPRHNLGFILGYDEPALYHTISSCHQHEAIIMIIITSIAISGIIKIAKMANQEIFAHPQILSNTNANQNHSNTEVVLLLMTSLTAFKVCCYHLKHSVSSTC